MRSATPAISLAGLVDRLNRVVDEQRLKPGDRLPSIRDLAGRALCEDRFRARRVTDSGRNV
ncbi:MAG: hypothetical protein ACYTGL_09030 [Planctomycetota bacterium]